MFGDTDLIGIEKCKINNNRIILPKFTTPSYKDELIFYRRTLNDIRLYKESIIAEKANLLFEELRKKLPYKEYIKYMRIFYGKMLSSEYVNKNNSILIPENILSSMNDYIYILGCSDHIKLFSTEEELKKHQLKKA